MYSLAISVGHNSSAVLIQDGHIIAGYEEERFSGKKADSAFPFESILELKRRYPIPADVAIYVSHWFPNGVLEDETKYWSKKLILHMFPSATIESIYKTFTHHDAHMESVRVFAEHDFAEDYHVFVMDGFGTGGEIITVYECHRFQQPRIILKFKGYMYSLGLFYQYATAYCGMKMHNHEYKMLAYETHILEVKGLDLQLFCQSIDEFSYNVVKMMKLKSHAEENLDNLSATKSFVDKTLDIHLKFFGFEGTDERTKRILVSFFAQRHIENVTFGVMSAIKPTNLLVAGGLFYNVKLNNMLANITPGKFCAMPLAGDQGAGIGVYQHYNGDLKWPGHLFWGHRDLSGIIELPGIVHTTGGDATYDAVYKGIKKNGFINLVRGSMEFGPRALCNTSTLAFPLKEIGEKINLMNDRTNEMPFALVMTKREAEWYFEHTNKIHKSLGYMIVTRKFRKDRHRNVVAGAHHYPVLDYWTCRPQVVEHDGGLMSRLVDYFGPLINTSWNYHGVPIVRSTEEIRYTHQMEQQKVGTSFTTVIEVAG
jgi:predicted NodU family carbamoyl transferase